MADTEPRKKTLNERIKQTVQKNQIPIFFVISIIILYVADPLSFQISWKGRVPYIIFLTLILFETITNRKKTENTTKTAKRRFPLFIVLSIPMMCAIMEPYSYPVIVHAGETLGVPANRYGGFLLYADWPLSLELIVLA